jgi:hydroxymethylpyrimidine/phosphomethylpyrimidine kinase
MDDTTIRVLFLKTGMILVSKIEEIVEREIGEPDCLLIDPVVFDDSAELEKSMTRFPSKKITPDTKMAISSDCILTMVTPDNVLLSEYLVAIG